ncbi:MAG: YbhB/YbcL family Raf kinase inhibitor-like protein [Nanoarchaeota archaeon]
MKQLIFMILILFIIGCAQEQHDTYLPEDPQEAQQAKITVEVVEMKLSSAYGNNEDIPPKYTCQGDNVNPPLNIKDMPEKTASLVLIFDDPDAVAGVWDHWIVFNIKPTNTISENSIPGTEGKNSWGRNSYGGPCPPSGTHRYIFTIYALDSTLDLSKGASNAQIHESMKGHILAEAKLVGKYYKK